MNQAVIRIALLAAAGMGAIQSASASAGQGPGIEVLSSRPDMVSGGSALVAVTPPASGQQVVLTLDGADVTARLAPLGGKLVGLVTGLREGANRLTWRAGGAAGQVTLVNHADGPIISGPRQMPFVCRTQDFQLPDGSNLGPPLDANCNIKTRVDYVYKSSVTGEFKPFAPTGPAPDDLAATMTTQGHAVPYIVRIQTGTINRSIYQFAVLFNPTRDAEPDPLGSYSAWNHKMVFAFGGGASAGYQQGKAVGTMMTILEDDKLSRGFAVVSSTLNVFVHGANDVVSAETASMVKEQFVKTFGAPIYTMGWGGSGGSMQQHLIANNYPGILDGIVPGASFPDVQSIIPQNECALMEKVFSGASPAWTEDQKRAVSGFPTWDVCRSWNALFSPHMMRADQILVAPLGGQPGNQFDVSNCPRVLARELIFDPRQNRKGVRCDTYTGIVNLVGIDPRTGHAARGFDNVGVVYGLAALRAHEISPEQFVVLNERIGGFDDDGQYQASRTAASPVALRNLYRYGRVNEAENLDLPMIDYRSEPFKTPDVHDSVRSIITRARLKRAHGTADNQVIIRVDAPPTMAGSGGMSGSARTDVFILMQMDAWLSALKADQRPWRTALERTLANKPAGLGDMCILEDGTHVLEEAAIGATGRCGTLMPYSSNSRMVAGEPLVNDYLKCALRPLRPADYPGLDAGQVARMRRVFASGVCDYTRPPVGKVPMVASWLRYTAPGMARPMSVPKDN